MSKKIRDNNRMNESKTDTEDMPLTQTEYEELRETLREQYSFYISNPPHTKGVNYSLWICENGFEYPIINSNTGGFTTFNSRYTEYGDGIEPTDEFFTVVGLGFHEAMCFMPDIYFRNEHFERRAMQTYEGKIREFELWAASTLINHFIAGESVAPELVPLAEWASHHTQFGVPALGRSEQKEE